MQDLVNASAEGNLNRVKLLIKYNDEHEWPLQFASKYGHINVVRWLVDNGSDVSADHNGSLVNACSTGHMDIVKYLIEHGANANEKWALSGAIAANNLAICKYLVEHGAIPNKYTLGWAKVHCRDEIANWLNLNFK